MIDAYAISALPAYALAVVMVLAVLIDIRLDLCRLISGRNVVILGIAAWYLVEAISLPEFLKVNYNQEQYNYGIMCVSIALGGFLAGYHVSEGCWLFEILGKQITFFDDDKWLWRLVLIGAVIGFAPIVYFTGSEFREMFEGMMGMRSSWGGLLARGRYGDARAAFLMFEMFVGAVAPFAAILLLGRRSTVVQRIVCAVVVIWPMLRAYGSGTRSAMITSFAVLLAVIYWKVSPLLRKRMIIAGAISAPVLYGLMAAIVISRGTGKFDYEDRNKADYVGNEMFRELLFITSKFPTQVPYQYGYGYYVQLVNPIPRFLWPGKPTLDAGILMADLYGSVEANGEATLTISPGLIGEMYMNFGIIGIVALSFFGGWLVRGWDLIQVRYVHSLPTIVYYTGGLAVLFIMGRSFTMGMFYGLLSLAVLAWTIRLCNPHAVAESEASQSLSPDP